MASAREYSNLTRGIRRDVVAMIEKAVSRKRKGEGLVVHGSQCHGFIDSELEMVRETNYLDGAPQRSMTLVHDSRYSSKLELSLEVSVLGAAGQAASKAAKKWGRGSLESGLGGGGGRGKDLLSKLKSSERSGASSPKNDDATQVLETERILRARRDASVVVKVREREAERSGGSAQAPLWSSVELTAEEIFRECSGKSWVGDKDSDHIYCTVKQSCNVDPEFPQLLSCIQLHVFGVAEMAGFI